MSNETTENKLPIKTLLSNCMAHIANRAACGNYYDAWSDKFSRGENAEAFDDVNKALKERWAEVIALSAEELCDFGFNNWDGSLYLIPLWLAGAIPDGEELTSIMGDTFITGTGDLDKDVRYGCIAFGYFLEGAEEEEEADKK